MQRQRISLASLVIASSLASCGTDKGSRATEGHGGSSASGGSQALGGNPQGGNHTDSGGSNVVAGGAGSFATGGAVNDASGGAAGKSSSGGVGSGGVGSGGVGSAGALSGGRPSSGGASAGVAGQASGGSSGSTTSGTSAPRIVGRTAAATSGSSRFSWSGVNIAANFSGTQVNLELNDGGHKNRFSVVIDGAAPKTLTTSGSTSLSLASGLTNSNHSIVVWRNTEAKTGTTDFIGLSNFGSGGGLLETGAPPDRRIEVIGDSISAGAGVEGQNGSCSNIDDYTNNYLAYGSVAARSLKADVVTIAWSGAGVYRGYSATDPIVPNIYDFANPTDKSAWDFAKYQPHVVVINLGTNDFSAGNPGQAYVSAYVEFVQHIRTKYANARFILIDMYGGERATAINSVIKTLASAGESKVEMLSFNSVQNNKGCNQHPDAAAQKAMGDTLAARIKTLMSWQ